MRDRYAAAGAAAIPLTRARLCPDCEEIFDSEIYAECPMCGRNEGIYIAEWLTPTRRAAIVTGGVLN